MFVVTLSPEEVKVELTRLINSYIVLEKRRNKTSYWKESNYIREQISMLTSLINMQFDHNYRSYYEYLNFLAKYLGLDVSQRLEIRKFKIPKRFKIFRKYPFAVLHDEDGNEVIADWLRAKSEMEEGFITVRPDVMGGLDIMRIHKGELQIYTRFLNRWLDEDISFYDNLYEADGRDGIYDYSWRITNLEMASGHFLGSRTNRLGN
ncbi:hypothetical protein ABE82_26160 (plasmid) [Paenibacillus peoriae]|uniref:hypothetical protein n=1 Tax=Paenibacillus peoriae TaxID=59893 RepID=UPI000722725A|nr:hypothetical protein [Paenibacillus peoriae]ALS09906.1 hypothetical protein ABE82_26160 [Paenibacillus peoriae]